MSYLSFYCACCRFADKAVVVSASFRDLIRSLFVAKLKWKKLQCSGSGPERRLGHIAVLVCGQVVIDQQPLLLTFSGILGPVYMEKSCLGKKG